MHTAPCPCAQQWKASHSCCVAKKLLSPLNTKESTDASLELLLSLQLLLLLLLLVIQTSALVLCTASAVQSM